MPITSSAELLRRWLETEVAPSQAELAARLSVRSSAISNWKVRGVPFDSLDLVDRALEADGVFALMAWGASTPRCLPASKEWDHNFPEFASPAWIWVRPQQPGSIRLRFRCGIVESRFEGPLSADGIIFRSPIAVANPPVRAQASQPVWMEFGIGEPPRLNEIPVVDVVRPVRDRYEPDQYTSYWAQHVMRRSRWRVDALPKILGVDASRVRRFFSRKPTSSPVEVVRSSPLVQSPQIDRLRAIRTQRGMSLAVAAREISQILGTEVSEDQLFRLEAGSTDPSRYQDFVLPALDEVLGARGLGGPYTHDEWRRTGRVELRPHPWWSGDIWISTSGSTSLHLSRGWYQKRVEIASDGGVVTARNGDSKRPLHIAADPIPDSIAFGYGKPLNAVDINDDWSPSSTQALRQTMRWGEQLSVRLLQLDGTRERQVFP